MDKDRLRKMRVEEEEEGIRHRGLVVLVLMGIQAVEEHT